MRDYLGKITDYLLWCKTAECEDDPWNADNMFQFLLYANRQQKAGTYAQRFVLALNWYLPRAEIHAYPKALTGLAFIGNQVDICMQRKRAKREAMPFTVRILEIIEELIMDENIDLDERSVYGFIRFIIGTRFRAFDAARIPEEPTIEANSAQGLIKTNTLNVTKNGQRRERRGHQLDVVAHSLGVTGAMWAQT